MNSAQRAVVAAAKKDGLSPMEVAAELMNHDITEVVLGLMRKREVAFNKLGEKEQDAVIAEIGFELKKITATAARVINSQGVECVQAKMKSLKIDGKLTATMVIEGDEPNRHVLTDKTHDKSDILIVLYSNNYNEGMSAHQGEKDQKPLALDDDEPSPSRGKSASKPESPTSAKAIAAKPIEIPPKLLADAIEFVQKNQVCATSSFQNQFKINIKKAEALQLALAERGVIELDDKGEYQIVRAKAVAQADPELYGELTYSEVQQTVVLHAQTFARPWLVKRFGIEDGTAKHLCLRLLDDEVIEATLSKDDDDFVESDYNVIAKLEDLLI